MLGAVMNPSLYTGRNHSNISFVEILFPAGDTLFQGLKQHEMKKNINNTGQRSERNTLSTFLLSLV